MKFFDRSYYLYYKLPQVSQKAKIWLLSCPNYRSKIWQLGKPWIEHCPWRITIVELPLAAQRSAVMHFSCIFWMFGVNINCLPHSQETFGTKFKQLLEKMVPVEVPYLTNVELPLATWGSATIPLVSSYFHAVSALNCIFLHFLYVL